MRANVALKPLCASVALLCAGVSMQASAQSSVTLYGTVDLAIAYSSNQGGHSNTYMNSGALNASKFGLAGIEDLGGGTQALFRLENGFAADTGAAQAGGGIFGRQAFVGLNNKSYGQVTLGRQYTPYWQYVGGLGPTGVLTGATGAHPGDVDALDTTLRLNNSVVYTSPVFGGLQASAQYAFGEQAGGGASKGSSWSAALRYDNQGFAWAGGIARVRNSAPVSTSFANAGSVGTIAFSPVNQGYQSAEVAQYIGTAARYTFGKAMLGLNYTNVQMKTGEGSTFAQTGVFNTVGAIGTYALTPALTLAAGYSYTAEKARNGITSPAKYHQFSMEQMYSLSKRTALYAIQSYQRANGQRLLADGKTAADAVAVVGDSQNGTPSNGRSQFVGMVGIRHHF